MKKFGFIGMGNMGYAILKGLLKTVAPDQLIFLQEIKHIWTDGSRDRSFLRGG